MKLLKFYAEWCNPCKKLTEMLETVTLPYEIEEVNIDEHMDKALQFNVRTVPAMVLVNEYDAVVNRMTGLPANAQELVDTFK
jgi:thioredoxin-like negative regulator of GroEL